MSKKVMVTSRSFGSISSKPIDILEEAGLEVVHKGKNFDQREFEKLVPEFDALIIGAHEFPEEVMAKCSHLEIVCKHGAGLDNIHLDRAKKLGITVCNAPGTNSNAVADLTMSFMLACARKVLIADRNVHAGDWKTVTGVDVYAKTLGLLGFGAIAKNVARRAHGFSMRVLAYDPYVKEVPEEFREYMMLCDKDELFDSCDFLSVHMPLTDETRNMVSSAEMARMKEGSIIINTARGGIVNEKDLYEAISSGHIAAAALDVSEQEPMAADNPLRTLENVIITPHIGMYSREAIEAVSIICAKNVVAKIRGEALRFKVI